jgi:hypothetical protein
MNTPAHVMTNLLYLSREDTPKTILPVITGSILPDAPLFFFYFIEKVIRHTPEQTI